MQSDVEYWHPWMTSWKLVEAVSIREAACIFTYVDPAPFRYSNKILPGEADAMETAIEQAILLRRLPAFAVWAYNPMLGEEVPVEAGELNPHMRLVANQTKILVDDLVQWADARGVPHCWPSNAINPAAPAQAVTYPPELQAAIEAFQAVHGDPRATSGRHPKQALSEWLASNRPELSANARDRIASVANWQPGGGAPKTQG